LFRDDFSRPANTNLNASTDGQSGALAPLTWVEQTYVSGTAAINAGGNLVLDALSDGNSGAVVWPDHNFTGLTSFTVTMQITSSGSGGDFRHTGFGIGWSQADIAAIPGASATNVRPNADVFIGYDTIGATTGLTIWEEGTSKGTFAVVGYPAELKATFTFADTTDGTTLDYEVFLNGSSVYTGSTTWTGTDQNYIGFSSCYTTNTVIDYVEVQVPGPPVLLATDPTDNATSIVPSQNLVATFGEPVFLNTTGSVTIKNLTTSNDTVISLPGPDPDGTLSVDGNVLTITPTNDLGAPGDEIAIEISADAIKDADDAFYPGLLATDDPNWSFTIDNIPPSPVYFHPISGTSTAPLDGALFIAFDEAPQIGTGNIGIYRVSDDSLVENIDVTSVSQNGNRIAIVPTVSLAYNTSYYVFIDDTAFTDLLGNGYAIGDSSVWTFSTIANDPTVLFGDSYNRADDTDLNASAGKYGTLGALTYTEVPVGVANVQLTDGQLLLESNESAGGSGAVVYPNHNFTDAAIASAGGFSVTVDLNAYASGGTTRYLSVALGQDSTDIDAQTSANATGSAGDLLVSYRGTNSTLEVRENGGSAIVIGSLPATPTKMRIDCSLTDFNATSTVNYEVFFDDSLTAFTSGSFTWSGSDENYISLSANLILTSTPGERHALFDNLQIRTLGSVSGTGFDSWKTTNSTAGGIDEDHDFDGVTNGVEYFIGGPNGNTTGFTALPEVNSEAGAFSVTFTKAADYAGVYGVDYMVETSATLSGWAPAPGGSVTFPSATEVKFTFPAGTKNFARLKVTGP